MRILDFGFLCLFLTLSFAFILIVHGFIIIIRIRSIIMNGRLAQLGANWAKDMGIKAENGRNVSEVEGKSYH